MRRALILMRYRARHSLVLRHFYTPLCSSTTEQPVDNRQTVENHHAEGPFLLINAGWLRQMSGGLKIRKGWRATNSSDHFKCGIDVTASMSAFQAERVGAAPTCRTLFRLLRGRRRKAPVS